MDDNRRFTRLPLEARACLVLPSVTLDGEVHDISLKGALFLALSDDLPDNCRGTEGTLNIELNDNDLMLTMHVRVAYVDGHHAGLALTTVGIDSASHLRRLVELNLGNEELLERELALLWDNR
ncbi:PilZ domain-containing protein [Salinispirillum marinum]|uniref:Cyclic diguanosine monophosphate-binding protein n=2 Tax=Saccharospirillaceae TaxID=255527 RepID=A0ABV8BD38_9GAMM